MYCRTPSAHRPFGRSRQFFGYRQSWSAGLMGFQTTTWQYFWLSQRQRHRDRQNQQRSPCGHRSWGANLPEAGIRRHKGHRGQRFPIRHPEVPVRLQLRQGPWGRQMRFRLIQDQQDRPQALVLSGFRPANIGNPCSRQCHLEQRSRRYRPAGQWHR